jgi:ABC-type uncharacterized transport system involved in gliding motility auxiliary subunit
MKNETPSARSARHTASLHSVFKIIFAFLILVMVNYLGFRHYAHKDMSAAQLYSLSPKTVDTLKALEQPMTIYTFIDSKNFAQAEQVATLLKEYQRVGGKNIIVEKIDQAYDYNRAVELQKDLHFDGNDQVIILKYKKDEAPRFIKLDDLYDVNPMTGQVGAFKGEQQITAAILALIEGKVSHVYFTEGHGEHSVQDSNTANGYGIVGQMLKNDNIQLGNLNLAQKGDVPADADAVVIAGPVVSFAPIEVEALDKYLATNGKLLVLLDPYIISGLDTLLGKYGLKYDDDLVLYRGMTTAGTETTVPLALIYQGGFSMQPITAKFAAANLQMLVYGARSITLPPPNKDEANPKTQFLLQSTPDSWGWLNASGKSMVDVKDLTYNKTTDIAGPVTVAAQYDGGEITDPKTSATVPATRVVVVGASKFLQNDTVDTMDRVGSNFFTNCVDWLVKKNAVLDIAPKKPQEYGVFLSPMSFRTVLWCAVLFVPGTALALGIFTWFSRRK